jgi:hypothetical protein
MRKSDDTILGNLAWADIKTGGFGFVSGMSIPADGTLMLARTDVGGAWRRESTASDWTQIVTKAAMTVPAAASDLSLGNDTGVFALAAAPNDASKAYMAFRGRMLKSTDRGVTWTDDSLNGATGLYMDSNGGNQRLYQHKLEVDPTNYLVAYFGAHKNTLWRRLSGAWASIATVPACPSYIIDDDKAILIGIDNTSALTGAGATSRRSIVYASSAGNGVYKSTDGGTTFSLIASASTFTSTSTLSCTTNSTTTVTTASTATLSAGMGISGTGIPANTKINSITDAISFVISNAATASATNTMSFYPVYKIKHMLCDAGGNIWLCLDTSASNNMWKYNGTWTQNVVLGGVSGYNVWCIEQDPKNASRFVGHLGGAIPWCSTDSCATYAYWQSGIFQSCTANQQTGVAAVMNALFGIGQAAAIATIIPHPVDAKDWIAGGWSMFYFASPWPGTSSGAQTATLTWMEDGAGHKELNAQGGIITPGGDVICASHDKAFIRKAANGYALTAYPATSLCQGYCIDWCIDNTATLAFLGNLGGIEGSGISTDGGRNVTQFASFPWTGDGGSIAAGNVGNYAVFPGQNYWPYYTTNGGTSWARCAFTGFNQILDGSENGWGFGSLTTRRYIVVSDKQNAGTFYAYNYGPGVVNRVATTISGNATITVDSSANLSPGMPVSGTGIPGGTTILSITNSTVMVLSAAPTSSGTPTLTITMNTISRGLWKSTDNGATFARVNSTSIINASYAGFHAILKMDRGILYLIPGPSGSDYDGDTNNLSYRSSDGGVNWTVLGQLYEINNFGIGAPAPGATNHTLYAWGWKAGANGYFRSLDLGATWTALNDNPAQIANTRLLAADPNVFDHVLGGYEGRGFDEATYSYKLRLKAS